VVGGRPHHDVQGLVVVRSGGETLVTTVERAPALKRLLAELGEPT
jgi:hypothetical protein